MGKPTVVVKSTTGVIDLTTGDSPSTTTGIDLTTGDGMFPVWNGSGYGENGARTDFGSVMRALYVRYVRDIDIDEVLDERKDLKEVLVGRGFDLTRGHIRTMLESQLLNDQTINFMLEMLKTNRASSPFIFLNTFFYKKLENEYEKVKRWTKNLDYTKCKKIFVPVHDEGLKHWFLVVVDLEEKTVENWDSLGRTNEKQTGVIRKWITEEYDTKMNQKVVFTEKTKNDIPRQDNGSDCGVFVYQYIERTVMGYPMNFGPDDISDLRRRMITNVLRQGP